MLRHLPKCKKAIHINKGQPRHFRVVAPHLEALEVREVPATISVTGTGDDITASDGKVTLREAVVAINAGNDLGDADITAVRAGNYGVNDSIVFSLGLGPQVHIDVGSSLTISNPVTIDGYAEDAENARPNSNDLASGINALLRVEVSGDTEVIGLIGFDINASNSSIRGLVVNDFSVGIRIDDGIQNCSIDGNFIGTDQTGGTGKGNKVYGIDILGHDNTVGGTITAARNLISGNGSYGVAIRDNSGGNKVFGNYIGTAADGLAALPNGQILFDVPEGAGVGVERSASNLIGGDSAGTANLISGNLADGVLIKVSGDSQIAPSNNKVQGNLIGTRRDGLAALANGMQGIHILGASSNTIGGSTDLARNIISGNCAGRRPNRVRRGANSAAQGNVVLGNYIGTDISGANAVANSNGVKLVDASDTVIGEQKQTLPSNVISGNSSNGIFIYSYGDVAAGNNKIWANYIGIDAAGAAKLGNRRDGIRIERKVQTSSAGRLPLSET